ncbi:MAG: hypothetical protein ACO2OS_07680 [Thermosphaera aggregans]|jgi:hypothetical protein
MMGMMNKDASVCEASYYLNGFRDHVVSCGEVMIKGFVDAELIIGRDVIILGGGKITLLAGENCFLMPVKNPLFVENAHCVNLVSIGGRGHTWISELNARKTYLFKTHVHVLNTVEAWLSRLTSVRTVAKALKIVFTSPHVYIEKLIPQEVNTVYTYRPYQDLSSVEEKEG